MPRISALVGPLVANFEQYLSYYEENPPFNKPEQLQRHRRTIHRRRELSSVSAALADDGFLDSLAKTLEAWGVGSHNAILVGPIEFRRQLRQRAKEIVFMDSTTIEHADERTADSLWRVVRSLDIVLNRQTRTPTQSKIVAGSKAVHHLLPELMPPIDRQYTAPFLGRMEPRYFQDRAKEAETFRIAFDSFRAIAKRANPVQYVDRHPWDTSRTKVIDNAIVGYIRYFWDHLD